MNMGTSIVTAILTILLIVIAIQHFRIRSLVGAVSSLGDKINKIEVRLSEVIESNKKLLAEQNALKSDISCRDTYEASNNDYQQVVNRARDRLSLQKLREKFGISSSLHVGELSDPTNQHLVSRRIGSEL